MQFGKTINTIGHVDYEGALGGGKTASHVQLDQQQDGHQPGGQS